MKTTPVLDRDMPEEQLLKLLGQRIYFGHQSVGYDIVRGLVDLCDSTPGLKKINILEIEDGAGIDGPGFYHSAIGRNRVPESKIEAFRERLESMSSSEELDVAFFKLCYVDIHELTNVEELFSHYVEAMAELKSRFMETIFVHVTVPLTVRPSGIRNSIKNLVKGDTANMARCRYNDLMTAHYAGFEPVFDLARIESTLSDGRRRFHSRGGLQYYSLVVNDNYTSLLFSCH